MFAFKGSFGFELIIPIDSLTVIPFSCGEKNQVSLIKQLVFFDRQNHDGSIGSFDWSLIRPVFGRD